MSKSKCSHPFDELPFFYYKRVIDGITLSNLPCFFAERKLQQGDNINNNYGTSLVSGMHILKAVCCMTASFPGIHFLYERHYFTGAREAIHMLSTLCIFRSTCCNHPL